MGDGECKGFTYVHCTDALTVTVVLNQAATGRKLSLQLCRFVGLYSYSRTKYFYTLKHTNYKAYANHPHRINVK